MLTQLPVEELIEFIGSSKISRQMRLIQIPQALGWNCLVEATRGALRRAGYKRYIARQKPPISEKTQQLRLAFAEEHVNWPLEAWEAVPESYLKDLLASCQKDVKL